MFEIASTLDDAVDQTRLLTGAVRRLSDEPFGKINDVQTPETSAVQRLLHCGPSVQQRTGSGHDSRVWLSWPRAEVPSTADKLVEPCVRSL